MINSNSILQFARIVIDNYKFGTRSYTFLHIFKLLLLQRSKLRRLISGVIDETFNQHLKASLLGSILLC